MADPKEPSQPIAIFANVMRVRHTATEFFIDFGQLSLDKQGVASLVCPPIVTTPAHAKQILKLLEETIRQYEQTNGEIKVPARPKETIQ